MGDSIIQNKPEHKPAPPLPFRGSEKGRGSWFTGENDNSEAQPGGESLKAESAGGRDMLVETDEGNKGGDRATSTQWRRI